MFVIGVLVTASLVSLVTGSGENLFSPRVRSWNVEMDPTEYEQLRKFPFKDKAEYLPQLTSTDPRVAITAFEEMDSMRMYRACNLTVNYGEEDAQTFTGAGCAFEGHGSLLTCLDSHFSISEDRPQNITKLGWGLANQSGGAEFFKSVGSQGCRRANYDVKAGMFGGDLIDGMRNLKFRGIALDASLMSSNLAYNTMDDWGMLASRSSAVQMNVNGLEFGIFDLVEPVDASFTKHRGMHGDVFFEAWPNTNDADSYDHNLRSGTKGVKAGQPLADLFSAASECVRHGCNKSAAQAITQRYTEKESWFDAFFALRVFYNFDQVTQLNVIGGKYISGNFALFLDSSTKKLSFIPWDYSETFKVVPPFLDETFPSHYGHQQVLGLYSVGKTLPPWWHLPTATEREKLCHPQTPPDPYATAHFTCDPVGHIMALAWKDAFFKHIQKYLVTDISKSPPYSPLQKANEYVEKWTADYLPSVTRQAALGHIPRVDNFKRQSKVILQLYAAGLAEMWTRAGGESAGSVNTGVAVAVEYAAEGGAPESSSAASHLLAFALGLGTFALLSRSSQLRAPPRAGSSDVAHGSYAALRPNP